ncbi:MAG: aminotransferase class V-fold PLP-dependent enzyme [Planctomycetes bacterium]|nr:aminotransferase class V-fold PLP-dependent enzyme [Planctomycetota bacterium]
MPFSRRNFLETGLAAAAGAAAGSAGEASADQRPTPQSSPTAPAESLIDPKFASPDGHQLATDAIHLGQEAGFSVTPIYQSKNSQHGRYQRPSFNPTIWSLEAKIKGLEGGAEAVTGPCGMSVIAQTYLAHAKAGDRIVAHRCNYDAVMTLLRDKLPRFGIEVELIDMNDPENLRAALKKKKTKFVHFEPYVNPTMEVLPALELIKLAAEHGAVSVVDNTWLTPIMFQPLRHGADLVIHSATKYIGGHGSAMGGVACGRNAEWVKEIRRASIPFGGLEAHPKVARVRYGGLESWAKRQQQGQAYTRGFGGMLGVEWKEGRTHGGFDGKLKLCKPWGSLGDVVTLVQQRKGEPDRGIPGRYTRIAVGLEDPRDIIADFQQALEQV